MAPREKQCNNYRKSWDASSWRSCRDCGGWSFISSGSCSRITKIGCNTNSNTGTCYRSSICSSNSYSSSSSSWSWPNHDILGRLLFVILFLWHHKQRMEKEKDKKKQGEKDMEEKKDMEKDTEEDNDEQGG